MKLHELERNVGAKQERRRVGRGMGSGDDPRRERHARDNSAEPSSAAGEVRKRSRGAAGNQRRRCVRA